MDLPFNDSVSHMCKQKQLTYYGLTERFTNMVTYKDSRHVFVLYGKKFEPGFISNDP